MVVEFSGKKTGVVWSTLRFRCVIGPPRSGPSACRDLVPPVQHYSHWAIGVSGQPMGAPNASRRFGSFYVSRRPIKHPALRDPAYDRPLGALIAVPLSEL
jgi:hypothetical protein